jgi:hypothetical protein
MVTCGAAFAGAAFLAGAAALLLGTGAFFAAAAAFAGAAAFLGATALAGMGAFLTGAAFAGGVGFLAAAAGFLAGGISISCAIFRNRNLLVSRRFGQHRIYAVWAVQDDIMVIIEHSGARCLTIIQQAARHGGMYCGPNHQSVVQEMQAYIRKLDRHAAMVLVLGPPAMEMA